MITIKQTLSLLLGLAVLVILIQQERLWSGQRRAITTGLAQDSLGAAHDTTRQVVTSDSANVWQQRAIQATQRADALDRTLHEERVARATVQLTSPAMDTLIAMPPPGTTQEIRQAPFTLSIEAPPPDVRDGSATLAVRVTADTLTLGLRIGCGPPSRLGVHPAAVSVSAPTWATVHLDQVEQDPAVCNAKALAAASRAGRIRNLINRIGISAGYATALAGNTVMVRPALMVGLKIWP